MSPVCMKNLLLDEPVRFRQRRIYFYNIIILLMQQCRLISCTEALFTYSVTATHKNILESDVVKNFPFVLLEQS